MKWSERDNRSISARTDIPSAQGPCSPEELAEPFGVTNSSHPTLSDSCRTSSTVLVLSVASNKKQLEELDDE